MEQGCLAQAAQLLEEALEIEASVNHPVQCGPGGTHLCLSALFGSTGMADHPRALRHAEAAVDLLARSNLYLCETTPAARILGTDLYFSCSASISTRSW